jgi:hypothetical protein
VSRAAVLAAAAVVVVAAAVFAAGTSARSRPVPRFAHVIVVVLENKERRQVVGSSSAPTFNALARRYAVLSDYHGVAHPSLPNYLALVSGSTHGIRSDCTACTVGGPSLADSFARSHISWKTYAEGLPSAGYTGDGPSPYAKKHVPFVYFRRVLAHPAWLDRIVPFSQLAADLRARRLPAFSLVVPNLCHDTHDCPLRSGDRWLAQRIEPLLGSAQLAHSVVFVVFDEGESDEGGGGSVAALALGPAVLPHTSYGRAVDHYGLLRTIEDAWSVPPLGKSRAARPITGIWR